MKGKKSNFEFLSIIFFGVAVVCVFLIAMFTCKSGKGTVNGDIHDEPPKLSKLEMTQNSGKKSKSKNDKLESL